MDAKIAVSHIGGSLAVPPSKSAAHRAVLCAALADGASRIDNIEYSDDIRATLDAAAQLGAKVARGERSVTIQGCGGGFATVTRPVFCNESGSTLRFLIPVFSLTAQKIRFTGAGRLFARPQEIYRALFEKQGLKFEQAADGLTIFGRLRPGVFTLPGDVSSQFISGLLFAAPLLESPSTIQILPPFESRSYVGMTLDALARFGVQVTEAPGPDGKTVLTIPAPQRYRPCDMAVEGDYSQAAFPAVLGALAGGVTVTGLAPESRQGDRVILDILQRCGAKFSAVSGGYRFERSLLRAAPIDLSDCPDLGPVLMAMACFCSGTTVIENAGRLRLKESDRIAAMQAELAKFGGRVESSGGTVTIDGCALHAPEVPLDGHNDHRVVMSLAVAALAAGVPAVIRGANAVAKSWPEFFDAMRALGARVELEE